MPNAKYDHTSTVITGEQWRGDRIRAYLFEGAVFDPAHTTLGQAREGAVQKNNTEIMSRSVGPAGEALGVSALFNVTPKGGPYQMVLAWDRGGPDMTVLAFYDEDENGEEIALANNGSLIIRPKDFDPPTGLGTWFVF